MRNSTVTRTAGAHLYAFGELSPEKKQRKAEWKLNEKMTANWLPVKLIDSDSNTSLLRED